MTEMWRTWRLLRELRANTRTTAEAVRALQDRLLRESVAHAAARVPFYRRFWAARGFDGSSFRGLDALDRIPVVDAATIKAAARKGELLADGVAADTCTYLDSSGSSGNATRILKQPREERVRRAVGLRIWFEHGFRWHDVTAQLQMLAGPRLLLQTLGISRKTWISTLQPPDEQRAQFLAAAPDVVVGTATALRGLCNSLRAAGLRPKRPRIVFTAGELLDVATRDLVAGTLGTAPIAIYGQTEVGYVAWQCERRDVFHVNADTHLVEVRRADRPARAGEVGRVVITDLRTRTMPFLRYDTGDLAVAANGPCACGRTLPTLASFEGRASAALTLVSGTLVTARRIVDALAEAVPPESFRLTQRAPRELHLEFLDAVAPPRREAALAIARSWLGEATLTVTATPAWPANDTGKTHAIVSHVPLPAWAAPPEGAAR